jgi:hypothetical protein
VLLRVVRDDFILSDQASAKQFEAALDVLYPIQVFGEKEHKEIRQDGTKWIFVRGKFFNDLKGFIVSTGADGKLTKIDHSLEIK